MKAMKAMKVKGNNSLSSKQKMAKLSEVNRQLHLKHNKRR